jgi:hypothetical protein
MNRKQFGGQQLIFKGPMFQKGYGLGGYFKRFFKWIVPLAEKHVLPKLKSGAQTIGKELVNATTNVVKEAIDGKNVKESVDQHFNSAFDNIKQTAETKLSGGKKRSIKGRVLYLKKKSKKKDYFD